MTAMYGALIVFIGCVAATRSAYGFQRRASRGAVEPQLRTLASDVSRALTAKGAQCDGDGRDVDGNYIQGKYHAADSSCTCAGKTHPV